MKQSQIILVILNYGIHADTVNGDMISSDWVLSIGSSSKNARFILDKVELTNYFDAISDGNNITKSKPNPEVFLKAAEFLGLDACDCAVVEDAYAGIDAAKAGNMCAIAIGDATSYEKADHKITVFSDLLKLF